MRRTAKFFALRLKRKLLERSPVVSATLVSVQRIDAIAVESWREAQVDTTAIFGQFQRLFVDLHAKPAS